MDKIYIFTENKKSCPDYLFYSWKEKKKKISKKSLLFHLPHGINSLFHDDRMKVSNIILLCPVWFPVLLSY